jgi:tRNA (guanine37-N1)-methyltransferase
VADKTLTFRYLTLFPEMLRPILEASLLGKAAEKGVLVFDIRQIRDHAKDRHRTVDESPYGGGDGMLMKVDVLHAAWKSAIESRPANEAVRRKTILLSPQGPLFTAEKARSLAELDEIVFVCGHYEGVDERFIELCVDEELSIGDYVLTGGELPALVATDAIARWIPGVIGKEGSVSGDSLEGGLLKYPQYTRPAEYEGLKVPEILSSGNHRAIEKWRHEQAIARTKAKRPDLHRAGKAAREETDD